MLSCKPMPRPQKPPWVQSLIEAMSVSGAMLFAAVGLLVWLRVVVQLSPRWRREKELQQHRKQGMPCGGPATIVVTDIERYSGDWASAWFYRVCLPWGGEEGGDPKGFSNVPCSAEGSINMLSKGYQ